MRLALNMIATTRLVIPDVNMAAATALHALEENGRERGILHGATLSCPTLHLALSARTISSMPISPSLNKSPVTPITSCRPVSNAPGAQSG